MFRISKVRIIRMRIRIIRIACKNDESKARNHITKSSQESPFTDERLSHDEKPAHQSRHRSRPSCGTICFCGQKTPQTGYAPFVDHADQRSGKTAEFILQQIRPRAERKKYPAGP